MKVVPWSPVMFLVINVSLSMSATHTQDVCSHREKLPTMDLSNMAGLGLTGLGCGGKQRFSLFLLIFSILGDFSNWERLGITR